MTLTIDEIKMLIESGQIPDDIAIQLAKDLLQTRREIIALNKLYEPIRNKAIYYIYCVVSNRNEAMLQTGFIDNPRSSVRARNDIFEIGRRLDAQFRASPKVKVVGND